MFTGIIEEIGKVERIQKDTCNCKLSIKASKILEDIHLGDSIAVNGICLTVTCFTRQSFTVDVMNETWNRTALRRRVGNYCILSTMAWIKYPGKS